MFLSRLVLHPRDLLVLQDLGDVGQLHRTLMRAFPQSDAPQARAEFGVLFRVEAEAGTPVVLVQSRVPPDWTALPTGYLLEQEMRDATTVLDALERGRVFRFRLTANPSKKSAARREGEPPPRNSRRVALVGDSEQHGWLVRRGEQHGYTLVGDGSFGGVRMDPQPVLDGAGNRRRSGIVVRPVVFEGRLRVEDPERLRAAVCDGVGPAKAYGCGLLSLGVG